jgi:hypothetical protein
MSEHNFNFSESEFTLGEKLWDYYSEGMVKQQYPKPLPWKDLSGANKTAFTHMARQLLIVEGFEIKGPPVHFFKGDKLKVIDIMDDGERCAGKLEIDEIVTMVDRSSECREFIIIEKANGRQVQLEKRRFVLHERAKK